MNGLMARAQRSLRARLLRLLGGESERPLEAIDRQELARIRHLFPRHKFFVSGYPRSGTTLLARLLRLHPAVECRWQAHFASGESDLVSALATAGLYDWLARPSNRWLGERQLAPALVRLVADYILERELEPHVEWVGDKTPVSDVGLAVGRLQLLYPEAHLILIVRDGRDVVLSQRIQAFLDQPDTLSLADTRLRNQFLSNPSAFGATGRSLFDPRWLRRAARAWNAAVGDGVQTAQMSYADRSQMIRYEDLIAAPQQPLSQLWNWLGAQDPGPDLDNRLAQEMDRNPAADWHASLAPKVAARLQRGRPGGWRAWLTPADLELFDSVARDGLGRWGYE